MQGATNSIDFKISCFQEIFGEQMTFQLFGLNCEL